MKKQRQLCMAKQTDLGLPCNDSVCLGLGKRRVLGRFLDVIFAPFGPEEVHV
jgi:hypothetical protein